MGNPLYIEIPYKGKSLLKGIPVRASPERRPGVAARRGPGSAAPQSGIHTLPARDYAQRLRVRHVLADPCAWPPCLPLSDYLQRHLVNSKALLGGGANSEDASDRRSSWPRDRSPE